MRDSVSSEWFSAQQPFRESSRNIEADKIGMPRVACSNETCQCPQQPFHHDGLTLEQRQKDRARNQAYRNGTLGRDRGITRGAIEWRQFTNDRRGFNHGEDYPGSFNTERTADQATPRAPRLAGARRPAWPDREWPPALS